MAACASSTVAQASPGIAIRRSVWSWPENSYLIREALASMLSGTPEIELLAVASNGNELRSAIRAGRPDVVITDIRMPPSEADDGIRIAKSLRETNPDTGVVVLSHYAEPAYLTKAQAAARTCSGSA